MMKVAIGVSGGGTTMEAIIKAAKSGAIDTEINFVFADRECGATDKSQLLGIKVVQKTTKQTIDEFHNQVAARAKDEGIDVVVLAGYLRLFPVTKADPYLVINSHPAAIPEFGGTGFWGIRVHDLVLEFAHATNFRHPYTYSTVHVASAEYDNGDILGIKQMEITEADTPETIAERLLPLEHQNYIEVLGRLSTGQTQTFANYDDLVLDSERGLLEKLRKKILKKYLK